MCQRHLLPAMPALLENLYLTSGRIRSVRQVASRVPIPDRIPLHAYDQRRILEYRLSIKTVVPWAIFSRTFRWRTLAWLSLPVTTIDFAGMEGNGDLLPALTPTRGFLSLPNETLSEIALYLGAGKHTNSLMRTCRRLTGVVEYLRYSCIVVAGEQGKNLLVSLGSGTPTAHRYCRLVIRLWFRGWHTEDVEDRMLMSYLFTTTLPLLSNMHTLLVESPSFDVDYLLRRMVTTGLVRENQHPSYSILDENNTPSRTNILSLLSLQNMRLSAPAHVLSLATNRPLANLDITIILDKKSFAALISGAENSVLGRSLTTLSLKMAGVLHIALAFPMIASAFTALQHLSIDQTDIDVRVRTELV